MPPSQRPTRSPPRRYDAPITRLSVSARQKLGLRYVTDDRLGEGTLGGLSVSLNLFLKRIGQRPFWRFGRLQRGPIDRTAVELVRRFDQEANVSAERNRNAPLKSITRIPASRSAGANPAETS